MKKKLQVFVSSTYLDLQSERQAAVQAILDAGHIPAGMELFRAGNKSQLATIKKWIDNSDVYMLILGGRYGSVDDKIGKSYTEIEYEYAVEKDIPIFAVVLTDSFLHSKAALKQNVFEKENFDQYNDFKKLVMSKLIKHVDDEKDIKLAVHGTLSDFLDEYDLVGWVRSTETNDNTDLIKENAALNKEKAQLLKQINTLQEKINKTAVSNKNLFGDYTFEELIDVLKKKDFNLPAEKFEGPKDMSFNALELFITIYTSLGTGVTNKYGCSQSESYIYYNIAPYYMSYGLCEKVKVAGVKWERIQLSKLGLRFYSKLESEGYTNKPKKSKKKEPL